MAKGEDKPLVWLRTEIKTPPLSRAARLAAGFLLRKLLGGERLGLPHSRPMPTIGPRCHALRVVDADQYFRIICRIDPDAIVDRRSLREENETDASGSN